MCGLDQLPQVSTPKTFSDPEEAEKFSVATLLLDLMFNFNLCGLFKIVLIY